MKQVIVMRTDLGMRKGKMIAQGAHASLGAVMPFANGGYGHLRDHPAVGLVEEWLSGGFVKICVRADSEEQLLELYCRAQDAGLITCLITDSGRTEFHGEPTVTCCAIGPGETDKVDAVTGELKLL